MKTLNTVVNVPPNIIQDKKIKLSLIKNAKLNREHGDIDGLKRSVVDIGMLGPVIVNQDNEILAGRRRCQVASELGWKEIPCRVLKSTGPLFDLKVEIDENLYHKPYTDLEVATKIKKYDELKRKLEGSADKTRFLYRGKARKSQCDQRDGWTNAKTAKALGISKSAVVNAIKIAKAVEDHPELARLKKGNKILKELKIIDFRKERKIKIPNSVKPPIIKLGDFRELIKELPENSVDLILTDPPYSGEYLHLWEPLAKEAARVLKPGGFLITYAGQLHFTESISALSKHLTYYWVCALIHKRGGLSQIRVRRIKAGFKPVLIFQKPPLKRQDEWFYDTFNFGKPDKTFHEWGQGCEVVIELIKHFSKPGDTVLDPLMGGGMTIEACMKTKRNVIGYEIEKDSYDLVKERLESSKPVMKVRSK